MASTNTNVLLARQFSNGEFANAEAFIEPQGDKFVVKIMLEGKPFFVGKTRGGVREFSEPKTLLKFCRDELKLNAVVWPLNEKEEETQGELKLS